MKDNCKSIFQFSVSSLSLLLISILLSACAQMPASIQSENINEISVQAVQQNTGHYKGQTVRWGGVITQVINNADDTWIEVLALPLNDRGKPWSNRQNNQGRFIAKVSEFLDPEVYQEGYSFTVIGILSDKIDGKIGAFNYSFPVVESQGYYLWARTTYRNYPYITPGYWYYGFNPYWQFGYGYYGYGVRLNHGYYPYYPFYGHLARNTQHLSSSYRTDVFAPSRDIRWPVMANPHAYAARLRENQYNDSHTGLQNNNTFERRANNARRTAPESDRYRRVRPQESRNRNRNTIQEK